MSFRIVTTDQRTDEWRMARLGYLTGSRASDMLAKIRTGEAASRRNLRVQLVLERLTGVSQEKGFVSPDMQYGIDREADAFTAYQTETENLTNHVGFLAHPTLLAGCSPDGEIRDFEGLLELKCCKSATHLEFLKTRRVPADYLAQITHNLWITGAKWCDYVSFDDRFPAGLQLCVLRVLSTGVDVWTYKQTAIQFLSEVEAEIAAVIELGRTTAGATI